METTPMGMFKNGSGYTVSDLVYYTGLFVGIIVVFGVGRPYGFHPLLILLVGVLVGAGLGFGLERLYTNSKRDADSGHDDQGRHSRDDF
jgi:hypothetical protein